MRKLLALLTACLLFTGGLLAQKNITGKVTDELGNPIPNASVQVKGSSTGTVTNAEGVYSLTVPADARVLVFSAVDMMTVEINIGSSTVVDASLKTDTKSLQEVVVVGYGTQQKKAFTGAASKIDAKEFSSLVTPSVDKQLAGRASGVQVSNAGGLVNTPARIRVRGLNSITGNLSPLIVVDGVPFITGNLAAATNSNALGDINPNDIENIEVLKDGSATAIFGSRAAGGVIMITTKKGAKGDKMRINYDASFGLTNVKNKWDLLNASEFVTIANEKLVNSGVAAAAGVNPGGVDTDWQNEVLVRNAFNQTHNLSFAGGTTKSQYYFSFGYTNQQGVIISNKNTSYRIRFNFESQLNRFIKFGNNTTLSKQVDFDQNNGSNALGGSIAASLRLLPNVSPYNPDHPSGYNIDYPAGNRMTLGANSRAVDDNFNNTAFTLRNNILTSDKHRIVNNAYVEISPISKVKYTSSFSYDVLADYSFSSNDPRHGDGFGSQGTSSNVQQNFQRIVWQNYANYTEKIGKHGVIVTAGHEIQKDLTKWFSANGSQVSDLFFLKHNLVSGAFQVMSIGGNYSKFALESLFGRVNYDFDEKYFLQASFRRDGLTSLAPENRYGVFPGFSAGWRISEEEFWQNSSLYRIINDFKLKGSYAVVGNPPGGFPYLSTFGSAPYGNISGLRPSSVGNRELKWERSKKLDIGIELGLLNNRFQLTADWFSNDIDEAILAVPTPPSAGVPNNSINQNIGRIGNTGFEISFSGDAIRKNDFQWSFNVNFTTVKNEVKSLYTIGDIPVDLIPNGQYNIIKVGESMNVIHGYQWAGVNTANGNPMYYNAAGTLVQHNTRGGGDNAYYLATSKDDNTLTAANRTSLGFDDRAILGSALPTWFGGFSNTLRYKGFDLDVLFRFSGGNKIMNITRQEILLNQSFQNNGKEILERWTTPGQVTNVPALRHGNGNAINQAQMAISRFVEKGDFIRLQNLTLGYNFDAKKLSDKTNGFVNGLRVFVQGQNLWIATKYTGADPENASEAGLDAAVSPQVYIISSGLKVTF